MACEEPTEERGLARYLTPLTAWALALGSSVGWGAFVMPGTTFLPVAGPIGAVAGIVVGALVMLVIAVNYHYLINLHPDSGGAFTFAKKILGYDHGFLCAWFLSLTYIAILWANASALPLIGRNLLGGLFQFGFSYEIAGFTIYFGEVLVAIAAIVAAACICLRNELAGAVQTIMAFALVIGVFACFFAIMQQHPVDFARIDNNPLNENLAFVGFLNIVALAPWAFVGFESISHSAAEFKFSPKKTLKIMAIALIVGGAVYAMLVIVAVSVQPQGYASWSDYIANLGAISGIEGLPTMFAAQSALGSLGSIIIGVAALGGIVTGLVGNLIAASRLLYSMACDKMLPSWFGKLSSRGVPINTISFIAAISLVIPFFGRTAISWIVDVTTIGATIAYAYTSECARRAARENGAGTFAAFGVAGLGVSLLFLLMFLAPNLLAVNTLSAASYLILATWSILGFAFFHYIFSKDEGQRLGHSTIVWIVLLFLILFTSMVWVRQSTEIAAEQVKVELQEDYVAAVEAAGGQGDGTAARDSAAVHELISSEINRVEDTTWINSIVQMVLIVISLAFLFSIYSIMQERQRRAEVRRALAEESSRAKTSFLSNMSHEIRTPMNAIIGLDNIALKDPDLSPRTREQLEKIGGSAKHLLGLINDILDMTRIESGRMALKNEEFAFRSFLDQINVIINGQCEDKGLVYECHIVGQTDDYYVGDDMKLKQVLINILGNSVKFTDPPGTVSLTVQQIAHFEGMSTMRFTLSDTGIGMDADYIPTIFEAFSQEDMTSTNSYGGSGLGMAITKNLVEMMNGEIQVESQKGVGTTFTVTVTLKVSSRRAGHSDQDPIPEGLVALSVDDDEVACEHAELILNDLGIRTVKCPSGKEAISLMRQRIREGEPFDLLLTDYRMPGMDGVELTKEVRSFDEGKTIIMMLTGYSFDEAEDEALDAGVDALLSKPLFTDVLRREIRGVLDKRGASAAPETDGALPDGAALGAAPATPGDPAPAQEPAGALEGCHVLLAEDIEINADIMMDILEMEEVTCDHAENGQVALEMFDASEEGRYDVILMDIRMPVLDGLATTAAIRKLDRSDAKTVPIIALSANAFEEDVQRSLQAGMNAHLSKPVDPDVLFGTIARLTGR